MVLQAVPHQEVSDMECLVSWGQNALCPPASSLPWTEFSIPQTSGPLARLRHLLGSCSPYSHPTMNLPRVAQLQLSELDLTPPVQGDTQPLVQDLKMEASTRFRTNSCTMSQTSSASPCTTAHQEQCHRQKLLSLHFWILPMTFITLSRFAKGLT